MSHITPGLSFEWEHIGYWGRLASIRAHSFETVVVVPRDCPYPIVMGHD
ncbi:hypothetical protein A2U01_0067012, partial [Trifolium medium]|nr:hypothetical protein [Trifolium medium]